MFRAVLFFVTLLPLFATAQTVVTFPDPNLEAAIREKIGKPTGDILNTDLEGTGFFILRAADKGISDLSGLEYCKDLQLLQLPYNQITNIGPLASLTSIFSLDLNYNEIEDLSPLAPLTSLLALSVNGNEISDLTALSSATEMRDDSYSRAGQT